MAWVKRQSEPQTPGFGDLAARVEHQESRGDQNAVSPKGAFGVMQLMPGTARDPGFGVRPLDPNAPDAEAENRRVGQDYLGAMLNRYGGDTEAALVAYNWGPGNADKWVSGGKDFARLPRETQGYVTNIMGGRGPAMGAVGADAQPAQAKPQGRWVRREKQPDQRPDLTIEVEQPGPQEDLGGALRTYAQGATFAFGDEIEAGLRGAVDYATGGSDSFGDAYDTRLDHARQSLKQYAEDNPTKAAVGELTGAVGPMLLTRGRAGTPQALAGRAAMGARSGASYGGLYGFGAGEGGVGNRLWEAVKGATVGGTVGAVLPLTGAAIGAAAGPVTRTVRGLINPEREAARRVSRAMELDAGKGLTPQQANYARVANEQPVVNVDRGGETTRALARSAANQSPVAREALEDVANDRFASQGSRVAAWLRNNANAKGDNSGVREALFQKAREANKPAYAKAYSQGDKAIRSEEIDRLMGAPEVVKAMKAAAENAKSRSIQDGFGAFNPGVRVTDDGRVLFKKGAQGVPTYPNLRFWDYTKRELDRAASVARRAGDNDLAARNEQFARTLRGELDEAVPSYSDARSGAAKFFGAADALEAGQKFVSMGADVPGARRAFAKMSAPERELFRQGFVSELMDKVSRTPDRANLVRRIWGSEKSRDQIKLALGDKKAKEFEALMNVEAVMDRLRTSLGNSTTARQLTEMGLAGTGAGLYTGDFQTGMITALTYGAGRKGVQLADRRVATRIGKMLASDDPAEMTKALKVVSSRPAMMQSLRSYVAGLPAIGAAQQVSGGAE